MTSLVWMRRDLRLHDHAALATALAEKADVQPVFIFDSTILERFDSKQDRRLTFIAETLCQLDAQIKAHGGHLLVLHGDPVKLMPQLAKALNAKAINSAEDFEPATRARDAAVKKALPDTTRFVQMLDHLMRAPQSMVKKDGTPYKVFTPYYKIWRQDLGPADWAAYEVKDKGRYAAQESIRNAARAAELEPLNLGHGPAHLLEQVGYDYTKDELWTVDDVQERLQNFIHRRLKNYEEGRNVLAHDGTSLLSPYLRHGLISVRECVAAAHEAGGGEVWISELGWREFYTSVLFHFPEVVEKEFQEKYRNLAWHYGERAKQAFYEGKTGYPVVDAAIRELLTTGFMHNRARMIVASFVTKDLLLDWRIGEEFFAQYLMDYELASNNGGWQWGASTGTDASPYFRVFNPVLQSRKFDPKGEYIRRYVPELREMDDKEIHAPWESRFKKPKDYPAPIVNHADVKEKVLAVFKKAAAEARDA